MFISTSMLISCCLTIDTILKFHNLSESASNAEVDTSHFSEDLCSNIPDAGKLKCQILLYCVSAYLFGTFNAVLGQSQLRLS